VLWIWQGHHPISGNHEDVDGGARLHGSHDGPRVSSVTLCDAEARNNVPNQVFETAFQMQSHAMIVEMNAGCSKKLSTI
jgi:hypothetical protein